MIAIVCGGRDYANAERVNEVLDAAVTRLGLETIIEGECPTEVNADKLARDWALARGDIGVIAVPATGRWPEAGPIRNALMFAILIGGDDRERKRGVICFPGGKGTANMATLARSPDAVRAGVKLIEVGR